MAKHVYRVRFNAHGAARYGGLNKYQVRAFAWPYADANNPFDRNDDDVRAALDEMKKVK